MEHRQTGILDKIFEIERAISREQVKNISLFVGSMGSAIFYGNLFELTKIDEYRDKCNELVERIIQKLSKIEISAGFCSGFTGISWAINYLSRRNLIPHHSPDFFDDIENLIYEDSLRHLEQGRYDYMHCGGGATLFAIDRLPDKSAFSYLNDYVKLIDRIKEVDHDGVKWRDSFTDIENSKENLKSYNFGIAHGIPSIINILLRIHKNDICTVKIRYLVEQSLTWLMKHRHIENKYPSLYPTLIDDGHRQIGYSRLAWCYGDLGLAWLFWNAGTILNRDDFISHSLDIMHNCINRRDPLNQTSLDAMFCHGTAGISHHFNKFYTITNEQKFKSEAIFWLNKTFEFSRFDNGIVQYFGGSRNGKSRWRENTGLLEGVAGIGSVLISHLKDNLEWDRCFLLAF